MERLFEKYPVITYNGVSCCDLTRRVKLSQVAKKATNLYYPLELKASMRADNLADAYYEDPELDWLIYLTNDIIDPYYQWYLNEQEFEQFIKDKYGSIEAAIKKIKYYRNNWAEDDREISPSFYENNLVYDQKQYYSPNYGNNGKIISYSRKKDDWVTNTNKIIQFDIQLSSGNLFIPEELVDIKNSVHEIVANVTVITCNTTAVIAQHVSGDTFANSTVTKTLVGETSNVTVNTNSFTILQENITNAEAIFWKSVSYLDWETEQNEKKKYMTIMNSSYTYEVADQLRLKMKE